MFCQKKPSATAVIPHILGSGGATSFLHSSRWLETHHKILVRCPPGTALARVVAHHTGHWDHSHIEEEECKSKIHLPLCYPSNLGAVLVPRASALTWPAWKNQGMNAQQVPGEENGRASHRANRQEEKPGFCRINQPAKRWLWIYLTS